MAKKIYIEQGETIPAVIIQDSTETAPTGFDEGGINDWANHGVKHDDGDYLMAKLEIKQILDDTAGVDELAKFNALANDQERFTCCLFNVVTGATAVPFLETYLTLSTADATAYFGGLQLQSIEDNAKACNSRYLNKSGGWYPIIFGYFDSAVAHDIKESARHYFQDYREDALFGMNYGDPKFGILDFINNTGGIVVSLEDFALLSGTDYTEVQSVLTKYFYR